MKTQYDKKSNVSILQDGDQVWFYYLQRKKGLMPKFLRPREGPFIVEKRLNNVVYRIRKSNKCKQR